MKKIAFVFSGQGSQYVGMGKDIYENDAVAKDIFDRVDGALNKSVSSICFEGPEEELGKTINTQPCVFAVDYVMAKKLESKGVIPHGVAGFSLGEYAALCFANVFELEEASKLVQARADAMQRAVPEGMGAMAAIIGIDPNTVESMCSNDKDKYTAISNYNSPQQIVVAGNALAIDELLKKVADVGGRGVRLEVSVPSHCELMHEAAEEMRDILKGLDMLKPSLPVYFNYSGEICDNVEEIQEMMVNQIKYPVRWTQTIQNMYEDGFNVFIECGPGKTLTGLIKKILKGKEFETYHVEDMETVEKVVGALK